jgi:hypothetical protein
MKQTMPTETCKYELGKWVAVMTYAINVTEEADYRFWARIMPHQAYWTGSNFFKTWSDNGFLLFVDNICPIMVGSNLMFEPTDDQRVWNWVSYTDGNENQPVIVHLTKGTHVVKFASYRMGVSVDLAMFTSDLNIVPTDLGRKF